MSTRFPRPEAERLLAKCHRRCCVCHRFCGVKMELDHMIPVADGGPSDIDNAIPLCFECHAEVHAYNDKHPRGRKFTANELRAHKEQWLSICEASPSQLLQLPRDADVGPLQALLDELDFNMNVAERIHPNEIGCLLMDDQFRRAIQAGAISVLREEIRAAVLAAYAELGRLNQILTGTQHHKRGSDAFNTGVNDAQSGLRNLPTKLRVAREALLKFVGGDDDGAGDSAAQDGSQAPPG